MTNLLQQAFEKAASLSDDLQDQIAQEVLDEIEGDARWDETIAATQDKLEILAEKAEKDFRAGKTVEMGFDEL